MSRLSAFVCSRPWSCRSERRVNNSVCSCHCCYTHIYPYWAMWPYRRVTLSDVSGKLFSTIINRRLQMWVDMNNTIGEQQAGFRKDYSTVDHIFTLLAIVQKQLSLNRKLCVAFIDFEKAFDSISRKLLWPFLQKQGIRGKLFQCVKSMYNVVKVRVRDGASLTESIHCLRGVKQGNVCSPVLFSLFINELALDIIKGGKHGTILNQR